MREAREPPLEVGRRSHETTRSSNPAAGYVPSLVHVLSAVSQPGRFPGRMLKVLPGCLWLPISKMRAEKGKVTGNLSNIEESGKPQPLQMAHATNTKGWF